MCIAPLPALRRTRVDSNGCIVPSKPWILKRSEYEQYKSSPYFFQLPCGQCGVCRVNRSIEWALRCVHEAELHNENSFITLTFDNDYLKDERSLCKKEASQFLKDLRKKLAPSGIKIRSYYAGEYGSLNFRPHYHFLIFGWRPKDLKFHSMRNGIKLFKSDFLSKIWSYGRGRNRKSKGFVSVGNVNYTTAAYVARYCTKKITGKKAKKHYSFTVVDNKTGEKKSYEVIPEFNEMSRRPGIGKAWYDKNKDKIYNDGFIVHNGRKYSLPKFYDRQFQHDEPDLFETIKDVRVEHLKKTAHNRTPQALRMREITFKKNQSKFKRSL